VDEYADRAIASLIPAFMAIPFPGKTCSGCWITVAPALAASSAVLSLEYASTTIISGSKLLLDAVETVFSIVPSSFLAGKITMTFRSFFAFLEECRCIQCDGRFILINDLILTNVSLNYRTNIQRY
jgi:hypothetical protein